MNNGYIGKEKIKTKGQFKKVETKLVWFGLIINYLFFFLFTLSCCRTVSVGSSRDEVDAGEEDEGADDSR